MSAYTIAKAANPDGSLTVVLGGTLSIETSGELHRILTEALDESAQIMLDFSAVENIDITSNGCCGTEPSSEKTSEICVSKKPCES